MRLVCVSDLHLGKWNNRGLDIAYKAVSIQGADLLYVGGDLAEPHKEDPCRGWERFEQGLEILSRSPAKNKLFTLGNNDLEQLRFSHLTEHYNEMRDWVGAYGFHLLDDTPCFIGDLAVAGNVGWYDGSLWSASTFHSHYPNTEKTLDATATTYFREREMRGKLPDGLTPTQFYQHCTARLSAHMDALEANPAIKTVIVGIHFLPDRSFLLADVDAHLDYLNWYMGATGHAQHFCRSKVALGLTGHSHRSEHHRIGQCKVYNISGPEQPYVFEFQGGNFELVD